MYSNEIPVHGNEDMSDFRVKSLIKAPKRISEEAARIAAYKVTGYQLRRDRASDRPKHPGIIPSEIIADISWRMGITAKDVISGDRSKILVHARRIIAGILMHRGLSHAQVANRMNRVDHTTSMNLVAKLDQTFTEVASSIYMYLEYVRSTPCKNLKCRCGEFDVPEVEASILTGAYARQQVACCQTMRVFPSIMDASRWLNDQGAVRTDTNYASQIINSCETGKAVKGLTWWRVKIASTPKP